MNTLDYQSPGRRRISRWAVAACAGPFVAIPVMLVLGALICPAASSHPTPAQAEEAELAAALLPQAGAFLLAFITMCRVSKEKIPAQSLLAILGVLFSVAISGLLLFGIVSSHAWLD